MELLNHPKRAARPRRALFALALLSALLLSSCEKKTSALVELPPEFAFSSSELWAVVNEPYSPFYDEPSAQSGIAAHARRGDAVFVTGRRITESRELWYRFEKGWMPESAVSVYSNQMKANKAAAALLKEEE